MKIKLTKPRSQSLWQNSPCSYNYASSNASIDNATRFTLGSIYYRDEVSKPKKTFNEFEKPDLLLLEFKRQIEEAGHPRHTRKQAKAVGKAEEGRATGRAWSTAGAVKLYQVPAKTEYRYDRHGWRTHHVGDYDVKQIETEVKEKKRFFSFGRRMDLSRPLNFFPGPGAYENLQPMTERLRKNSNASVKLQRRFSQRQNPQVQISPQK